MDSISTSRSSMATPCTLNLLVIVGLLFLVILAQPCHAIARLIHVPLQRAVTRDAGQLGQPIVNYYSLVHIGTPPVTFKVQFDVGLSDHFVPHFSWNPFNRNLHYSDGFKCKSSSTCSRSDLQFTFGYQDVQLTGKRYEDSIGLVLARLNGSSVGDSMINYTTTTTTTTTTTLALNSPITWRQNFLAISSTNDGRFSQLPIDGFFGLSPASQAKSSSVNNLLVGLQQAQLIDNLQFSLWFNPVLDSPQGGELVLGGVDTSRYQGQIYWHQMVGLSPTKWQLSLQQVTLGNQIIGLGPFQAVLSSGLSDIMGPSEEVRRIYNLLNTTRSSSGLELIDCRRVQSLPYITFHIDGIPYYLLPSNYIRKTIDGRVFKQETCYVAILANPSSGEDSRLWTLATPFLGAYYTIFDLTYRQLGFAALK